VTVQWVQQHFQTALRNLSANVPDFIIRALNSALSESAFKRKDKLHINIVAEFVVTDTGRLRD